MAKYSSSLRRRQCRKEDDRVATKKGERAKTGYREREGGREGEREREREKRTDWTPASSQRVG